MLTIRNFMIPATILLLAIDAYDSWLYAKQFQYSAVVMGVNPMMY